MNSAQTFLWSVIVTVSESAWGQDVRAASYELVHEGGLQYLNRLKLYVDTDLDLGRDSVYVFWGANWGWLPLTETEALAGGQITKHTFQRSHTYPGPASYGVDVSVDFRIPGIINFFESEGSSLRLEPSFIQTPLLSNSSPQVTDLTTNIQSTPTGATYTPATIDADGDSLSFSLTQCYGAGYYIPPGTSIEESTGTITTNPPAPGLYAFCTRIDEYRDGQIIGTTYTDMVMQVDHVAGTPEPHLSERMYLAPNAISQNETVVVRTPGSTEVKLFDGTGKIAFQTMAWDGDLLKMNVSSGSYTYQLTAQGVPPHRGKLVVF